MSTEPIPPRLPDPQAKEDLPPLGSGTPPEPAMLDDAGGLRATRGYIGRLALGPVVLAADKSSGVRVVEYTGPGSAPPDDGRPCRCSAFRPQSEVEKRLLHTIHGFYIQAFAVMGRRLLREHGRGIVMAGYCHGLHDPVTNIITNALLYSTAFPAAARARASRCVDDQDDLSVITCSALTRLVTRSLQALVVFLISYAPPLTIEDALVYLCKCNLNLMDTVEMLQCNQQQFRDIRHAFRDSIHSTKVPNVVGEVYDVFFSQDMFASIILKEYGIVDSVRLFSAGKSGTFQANLKQWHTKAQSLCEGNRHDQLGISVLLDAIKEQMKPQPSQIYPLSQGALRALNHEKYIFKKEKEAALALADFALRKHAMGNLKDPQDRNIFARVEPQHDLDIICGVIFFSSGANSCYHINFIATPKDKGPPVLFFAEARGALRTLSDVTVCCPVSPSFGGCSACESKGVKLYHPYDKNFYGREELTQVNDPCSDATESFTRYPFPMHIPVSEDYDFFHIDHHYEVVKYLETSFSGMNDDEIDIDFMWYRDSQP